VLRSELGWGGVEWGVKGGNGLGEFGVNKYKKHFRMTVTLAINSLTVSLG